MHYDFEDFFYLFYCPDKTGMAVLFHRNMQLGWQLLMKPSNCVQKILG